LKRVSREEAEAEVEDYKYPFGGVQAVEALHFLDRMLNVTWFPFLHV
jgi:hypothetical protein